VHDWPAWGLERVVCWLGQPVSKDEFGQIFGPAAMHAIGHIAANLSFAAVAISLTHTVKTLEPAFNVLLSKLFLGVGTPAPVVATLIPIMVRMCPLLAAPPLRPTLVQLSAAVQQLPLTLRAMSRLARDSSELLTAIPDVLEKATC
jgi:hypothetical protein